MIFALILAVLLGVILGASFTAHAMGQIIEDRCRARDRMWEKALHLRGDRSSS